MKRRGPSLRFVAICIISILIVYSGLTQPVAEPSLEALAVASTPLPAPAPMPTRASMAAFPAIATSVPVPTSTPTLAVIPVPTPESMLAGSATPISVSAPTPVLIPAPVPTPAPVPASVPVPAPVPTANTTPSPPDNQPGVQESQVYLPLVRNTGAAPSATAPEWLRLVNAYRQQAGVPLVVADDALSSNCWEHARYMAENDHLTHYQNPQLPWASAAGEQCANNSNAWMGPAFNRPLWSVQSSIAGWMGSVGHRLWLLYPTTPAFGYGFYTAANNRSGAALDVLSHKATIRADAAYAGWPVRYPAPNQTGIPAQRYPITLNWPYFGPVPTLNTVRLTTASGAAIAHTADTALPVDHKGIQIIPTRPLPPDTAIVVTVTGTYTDRPFTYTWEFTTGAAGR